MKKMFLKGCCVVPVLLVLFLYPAAARDSLSGEPGIIPRKILFGNPVRQEPKLSPDGKRLSYLAPSEEGVMNVWIKTLGKEDDTMVSLDKHRGIGNHTWSKDGRHILYFQDRDGDENFHVFMVDPDTRVTRDMTPFAGIRAVNMIMGEGEILVGLNIRNRQLYDMYRIDLETGAIELDTENPGDVAYMMGNEWVADRNLTIRAVRATNLMDGSSILKVRDGKDRPWRILKTWPFGSSIGDGIILGFSADNKDLYVFSSLGADTLGLVRMDALSGEEKEVLVRDRKSDAGIENIPVNPLTFRIQAVSMEYLKPQWKVLDETIRHDFDLLKERPGFFKILSRDRSDSRWIVSYEQDNGPVSYYLYERATESCEFLFYDRPELQKYVLAKMQPVVIEARDGLALVSYLTLPEGLKPSRLPLVLFVHGGPMARDSWGYNPDVQLLANRGYAVLQVNFRGSAGFGKAFENAGDRQMGIGMMQHDLTDAVRWAVEKGIADPARVAVFGGSYGGYAVLAGLAFTPALYACGVDICGPSNLKTMFEALPPHWAPLKKLFIRKFGDAEADEAYNRRVSPLFHADSIRSPLLIGQGLNDPRCKIQESDQMVKALRDNRLPVTYVVYTDEGHGFRRPENRMDFYGRMEVFLAEHLGGRHELFEKISGSSSELR